MLLLSVVLLVGAYVLLPFFLENLIAEDLQSQFRLAEKPEVNLEGNPLNVLAGRFEGGHITFTNPDLGGLHPDSVMVDLDPFDLDVLRSVTSGQVKSDRPLSGNLKMKLSEEEIDRIAASTAVVKDVKLEEGRVAVNFGPGNFGARVPVSVEGNLVLRDGMLHFEPDWVEALGASVPQRLLRRMDFSYPINGSPFAKALSNVEVHKDRLVLSGRMDNLPVG